MNTLLYALVVGGLAGWITGKLLKDDGFRAIWNIGIGIIGGALGDYFFKLLDIADGDGLFGSMITAAIGAIGLVFVLSLFKK